MANTLLAVVGKDDDSSDIIFRSLGEFPSDRVVIITEQGFSDTVQKIKEDLSRFGIDCRVERISDIKNLEQLFMKIKNVKDAEGERNVVINVDTDYMSSCLALSSAFVNGIQAIGLMDGKLIAYPIMKFSYYSALSEKKLKLLRKINEEKEFQTIESLSRAAKINMPLTAYHINGTREKPGLVEMGLIKTQRSGRSTKISLTKLGELLVQGAVGYEKHKA